MRLPLELSRAGNHGATSVGETRNLSSAGVLFTLNASLNPGEAVEYVITLDEPGGEPVRIRCLGKVVRTAEPQAFAATLERYEFVRAGQ